MRSRCNNPKFTNYATYGGRGIKVCERWDSFENFLEDMGPRPKGYTIDRIDPNGDYCPENCRWASWAEQQRNRRDTRFITWDGRTQCVTDWADELGIPRSTISWRLQNGRSDLEAIGKA